MVENPFGHQAHLDTHLQPELYQRIHYVALRTAGRSGGRHPTPEHIDTTQLHAQARMKGADVYLVHPADLARVFAGVTLRVYQCIDRLYCCRLERSIPTVWRILEAMATQAQVPPITYEAVWAICIHLRERHEEQTAVTMSMRDTTWHIAPLPSSVLAPIVCIIDLETERVLAFRRGDEKQDGDTTMLALYDACIAQRQPARDGATGLAWSLPMCITTEIALSPDAQQFCAQVGIQYEARQLELPFLDTLRDVYATWPDNEGASQRFVHVFDNYLAKAHGYGPVIDAIEHDHQFTRLTGYNRDPAWQFPALRRLLPAQSGVVDEDGSIECDGLHFEDELLTYWIGQPVTVRRSLQSDAAAYVYVDDEILCLAMARELRRSDGSYRTHLPGRSP